MADELRYSFADLEMFCALAAQAAIEAALLAIDGEPELPGDMPDEMWAAIQNDRDAIVNAMRIAVRQTKSGIRTRLLDNECRPQHDSK